MLRFILTVGFLLMALGFVSAGAVGAPVDRVGSTPAGQIKSI